MLAFHEIPKFVTLKICILEKNLKKKMIKNKNVTLQKISFLNALKENWKSKRFLPPNFIADVPIVLPILYEILKLFLLANFHILKD